MVEIINANYEEFSKDIYDKKLFLYGAGKRAQSIYKYFNLQGKVKAIIDKNNNVRSFQGQNEEIPVISVSEFEENEDISKSIVLIVPTYMYMEIIDELDRNKRLNGLRCYVASLIQDSYEQQDFDFTKGERQISKKIHYCWFGGADIPEQIKNYIESWHLYCPQYEFIKWNEDNYDITKNQYMKEAYEAKKWGYVSDYARLDIVYNEGGIYLDTDVELLTSLDPLLNDAMFLNFDCRYEINTGLGFGAVKGHELVKKMRDYYDGSSFYNEDGTMNITPCAGYQNPVLEGYGFKIDNSYQKKGNVVLYPSEVANPTGRIGAVNNFTSRTIMIHHAIGTHKTENERKNFVEGIDKIQRRLNLSIR